MKWSLVIHLETVLNSSHIRSSYCSKGQKLNDRLNTHSFYALNKVSRTPEAASCHMQSINHQNYTLLPSSGGKGKQDSLISEQVACTGLEVIVVLQMNTPVWKLHWGLVMSARPVSEALCNSWSRARYCCWAWGPSSDSRGLFRGRPCFWKVNFRPPSCYTQTWKSVRQVWENS